MTTLESRVAKLEKAVFNFIESKTDGSDAIVGKLVVNKEGKMEKELLKNGYTEKQILDMQKGMIDFITDGGKKPLGIPVTPVNSSDAKTEFKSWLDEQWFNREFNDGIAVGSQNELKYESADDFEVKNPSLFTRMYQHHLIDQDDAHGNHWLGFSWTINPTNAHPEPREESFGTYPVNCKTCLNGSVCDDEGCHKEHCDACDEFRTEDMELDEYYDYQAGEYSCFKEWKNGAHKRGYTSEEDDKAIIRIWNDHGLEDLNDPCESHPKDQKEADGMIKFMQGYDAKCYLYKLFYDWGVDEYNEKTFMSKFLDGELNTGYYHEAGTPEHYLLMAKWWIENNVPLHDHEKDHGDRKHWNYDTTNPDEHCPTHLAKFDVEQFRESEMYDPHIGLPFLAFNVQHDSFTKFKNWFWEITGMCCSDLEEPHTHIEKDSVIMAWDQAWEDKKAYWNWKPSEYDELKESLLGKTTQIEKNSLARIQRIHKFYIGEEPYWYRKREFKNGNLDHINDDIEVVYYPENDELNSNEYLRTNIPHGAWVVEERSHLDVPNASCRGEVNGILVFNSRDHGSQTCHMEAEFGIGKFSDGNSHGWYHQQNNRWGRPTDHYATVDGSSTFIHGAHCTKHKSQHDRACKWEKHCDECVEVSAKYEAMREKMRTNDAWWLEQIKNDYEHDEDLLDSHSNKTWDELTKKDQKELLDCHSRYGGEEGWHLDYIFEYKELDKEIEELKAKQIDEDASKRCGFMCLKKPNDRYIVCGGGQDVCMTDDLEEAKIYAHHIDGCVLDSQDDNNGVFKSDGYDEAKECAKLDENCGKMVKLQQEKQQKEKVTCPKCNHNFELNTYLLPNPHEGKDES